MKFGEIEQYKSFGVYMKLPKQGEFMTAEGTRFFDQDGKEINDVIGFSMDETSFDGIVSINLKMPFLGVIDGE